MSLAAGIRLGPYEIVRIIGRGGMGEVYEATDTRLDRPVAVKILSPDFTNDPGRRDRFSLEAKAIARLSHPSICMLLDVGQHANQPFLVMELMRGQTLRERFQGSDLTITEALDLAVQLGGALAVAHDAGIIHRDIKPSNIFITDEGSVKLLDFGLAKQTPGVRSESDPDVHTYAATARGLQLTEPGSTIGTAAYMSPEQARGEVLDARTDIFSAGAVLYEMVAGRQAFEGATTAVVFDAILNRTPTAPAHFNARVPPQLHDVIAKALEKDRALRYQTATELRADLMRARRDLDLRPSAATRSVSWASAAPGPGSGTSSGGEHRSAFSSPAAALADHPGPPDAPGSAPATPPSRPGPVAAARSTRWWPWVAGATVVVGVMVGAALRSTLNQAADPAPEVVRVDRDDSLRRQIELAERSLATGNVAAAAMMASAVLALDPSHAAALRIFEMAEARRALAAVPPAPAEALPAPVEAPPPSRARPRPALSDGAVASPGPPAPAVGTRERPLDEVPAAPSRLPARDGGSPAPPPSDAEASVSAAPRVGWAPGDGGGTLPAPVDTPVPTEPPPRVDGPAAESPPSLAAPAAPPGVTASGLPAADVAAAPASGNASRDAAAPASGDVSRDAAPLASSEASGDAAAIRQVIASYEQAIEHQDLDLFARVMPRLSNNARRRVATAFAAVTSHRVDIRISSIDIRGDEAVVRLSRTDSIDVSGRRQTQDSNQSITLERASGGWVITALGE